MRCVEGVSLVELVMVIVILGILGAFVGPVLLNAVRAYERVQDSTTANAKIRYAVERISREMRDIRRQVTTPAGYDIVTALPAASSLVFFKTDGRRVELTRSSTVVNLAYSGTGGMLIDGVQSFSLAFFQINASGAGNSATAVAFIQTSMSIVEGSHAYPVRFRVDLKNPQ